MVGNLEKWLWGLIDGSHHVAHGVVSLERICHASEQSAEPVPPNKLHFLKLLTIAPFARDISR
jgi:hypothetical protein